MDILHQKPTKFPVEITIREEKKRAVEEAKNDISKLILWPDS